jgi:hypothetical protein
MLASTSFGPRIRRRDHRHSNNVTNLASFKVTEQQPHVDITKVSLGRSGKAGEAGDHNYHRVTSAKRLNLSASTASPEFASETRESTNIEVCIKVRSDACLDFTSPSTVNFRPTNSHFLLSHRHSLLHPQIHTADQNQHAVHCSRTSGDHRLSCLGADFQRVCLSQPACCRPNYPCWWKLCPQWYSLRFGCQLLRCELDAPACLWKFPGFLHQRSAMCVQHMQWRVVQRLPSVLCCVIGITYHHTRILQRRRLPASALVHRHSWGWYPSPWC